MISGNVKIIIHPIHPENKVHQSHNCVQTQHDHAIQTANCDKNSDMIKIFDINAQDDKFLHSLMFSGKCREVDEDCQVYKLCKEQSDMDFGFVPLTDPIIPDRNRVLENLDYSPWQLHALVKQYGCPNFMGARIPVKSQLNVPVWKCLLSNYWDQQLLQFLEFGFSDWFQ